MQSSPLRHPNNGLIQECSRALPAQGLPGRATIGLGVSRLAGELLVELRRQPEYGLYAIGTEPDE